MQKTFVGVFKEGKKCVIVGGYDADRSNHAGDGRLDASPFHLDQERSSPAIKKERSSQASRSSVAPWSPQKIGLFRPQRTAMAIRTVGPQTFENSGGDLRRTSTSAIDGRPFL